MANKGLVIITGLNGFIAGRAADALLHAGYSVLGTGQSRESARATLGALAPYGDQLGVVEVPDMAVAGAFDEAMKDVDGVIRVAQPVSFNLPSPGSVLDLVRGATTGILESASKLSSAKSVVLMSSTRAVVSKKDGPYVLTENNWKDGAVEAVAQMGDRATSPLIYLASKTAGERAFWKFHDEKKPAFTMTAINPV